MTEVGPGDPPRGESDGLLADAANEKPAERVTVRHYGLFVIETRGNRLYGTYECCSVGGVVLELSEDGVLRGWFKDRYGAGRAEFRLKALRHLARLTIGPGLPAVSPSRPGPETWPEPARAMSTTTRSERE